MYYDANNLYGWAMSQSLLMEILDGLRGKIMKKFTEHCYLLSKIIR